MQFLPSDPTESDSPNLNPGITRLSLENNVSGVQRNLSRNSDLSPNQPLQPGLSHGRSEPPPPCSAASFETTPSAPTDDSENSSSQERINTPDSRGDGDYQFPLGNPEVGVARGRNSWDGNPSAASPRTLDQTEDDQITAETLTPAATENGSWGDKKTSLPADDGMSALRRRIHAIRESDTSHVEKAKMIHAIMTENYKSSLKIPTSSQPVIGRGQIIGLLKNPQTPLPVRSKPSSDQPAHLTHTSVLSDDTCNTGSPFYLTREDLIPTYVPDISPTSLPHDDDYDYNDDYGSIFNGGNTTKKLEEKELGCEHYRRNVKLQCVTCKRWYSCRFCHDGVEDHTLIRHNTENMLCMLCQTPQQASQWCISCGAQTACYYCGICKLWDNDASKSIYHCHDCGICRRGEGLGKDYFHCKVCSVCLPINIETSHRCIERATQCDCPICGDYMFTSPDPVIFMKCGHSIHQKCFDKHSKVSYRCPICNKSITNMEAHFRNLDRTIESQPMPAEFKNTKAVINCNDCRAKCVVQYHWLGLKCDVCDSYNTSQIRLFSTNDAQITEADSVVDRSLPISMRRGLNSQADGSRSVALSVPGAEAVSNTLDPLSRARNGTPPTLPHSFNGRSVSPTVSNYFGLSRRRGSIWDTLSQPDVIYSENEDDEGNTFWAVSALRRATLGLLGGRERDEEEESNATLSTTDKEAEPEEEEGDDDEDIDDIIDIFGHR